MLPDNAQRWLDQASQRLKWSKTASGGFHSDICGTDWDRFIERQAGRIYMFLLDALGPFYTEPKRTILAIEDGFHSSGANASFEPGTGQVRLCPTYVEGKPGITLEKLCHEFVHASLDGFPEGDPFYEEGEVDYSVWVLAHAPYWEPYRRDMIEVAAYNIKCRRDRAMKTQSDYDRKRWAGGLYAATAYGPYIIARLRQKKAEGDLTW